MIALLERLAAAARRTPEIMRNVWRTPSPLNNSFARRLAWWFVGGAVCTNCWRITSLTWQPRPRACPSCGVNFSFTWRTTPSDFRPSPRPADRSPLGRNAASGGRPLLYIVKGGRPCR